MNLPRKGYLRFVLGLLLPGLLAGQGVIDIPGLQRENANAVIPVAVRSGDANMRALAGRAFSVHGAFNLVAEGNAKVVASLAAGPGANQVTVTILGGNPARELARETLSGGDWREATLRACDAVVRKVAGLPGFFGGKLAFVGERTGFKEIYVGDLFFQRYQAVTQDRSESLSPRFSPDGNRLLYTGYYRSGFPEVYLLDLGRGARETIARYRGTNTGGTFSPDGQTIALVLSSPGNPELFLSDLTTRRPRRMTLNTSLEASPTFSPDGKRVAVTSDPLGGPQIYVLGLDQPSRNHQGMERVGRNLSGNCSEPAWNPVDKNLLAFTVLQGRMFQVAITNLATGKSEVLTGGRDSSEPCWTSDGRHLIYTQRTGAGKQLRLLDTVSKKSADLHSTQTGNVSQASFVYPK